MVNITNDDILATYLEEGHVDTILGPLSSGKEAQVYLALLGEEYRAIKIFKEADERSFKCRTDYTMTMFESHRREARAIKNKSSFGKELEEDFWHSREINTLRRLHKFGANVPRVITEGVRSFMMECCRDENNVSTKLGEWRSNLKNPERIYKTILHNMTIFINAGIVHGDLSPYNILCDENEKITIIDFPQSVKIDAVDNHLGMELLLRDLKNVTTFFNKYYKLTIPVDNLISSWAEHFELSPREVELMR
ncbi:MAG: hypothetical protein A2504_10175 [Bdellovibrionales bacterium RIFOXYD12_FULL_39_22]|nr:MAG: hypothetical protein A2385_17810 [Bdellovibrionales bacterium RIFOXYB1_FULL_39_21]OFZ43976.1 MAG: hypothetical protein A2485_04480 [Bdellovibrionales bacterium RIFOXYC12_FULL_39_17]OFZ48348.1 MAG: hypothetical protein A2404_01895 [Bdellovibrionales bacterium RIFOXYC1_FULL_39_130]OFZ71834.1 MAG: hypothetical protein A2451_12750 [Bdellovibrionales bacterium RIFOXYC2_FULL_39_8]OFZ76653.1 MAG: hypothetical protein A2560_17490 [Bdellovibrionales bacterium RIFOXYD1_FULL_39_84]OFZ94939.1 MAG: